MNTLSEKEKGEHIVTEAKWAEFINKNNITPKLPSEKEVIEFSEKIRKDIKSEYTHYNLAVTLDNGKIAVYAGRTGCATCGEGSYTEHVRIFSSKEDVKTFFGEDSAEIYWVTSNNNNELEDINYFDFKTFIVLEYLSRYLLIQNGEIKYLDEFTHHHINSGVAAFKCDESIFIFENKDFLYFQNVIEFKKYIIRDKIAYLENELEELNKPITPHTVRAKITTSQLRMYGQEVAYTNALKRLEYEKWEESSKCLAQLKELKKELNSIEN